ncbi:SMAD/FHA domain-containing protein [Artemisia annua]|uniref:SMAD/FHA domain-containing protein n=1 Tax=Artemisia annua TaxID=35608 RepID=A0A2U1M1J8_ARTAN|nr:SMAD/FHA domain-containing protein [Artemisia annua]
MVRSYCRRLYIVFNRHECFTEGSSVKGLSEAAHMDKGKKVAEELENRQDGAEGSIKKTEPDSCKWDLEKMTLGDFFDYLEEQLPKQIIDESEKIIADLEEKARQCYRIRQEKDETFRCSETGYRIPVKCVKDRLLKLNIETNCQLEEPRLTDLVRVAKWMISMDANLTQSVGCE